MNLVVLMSHCPREAVFEAQFRRLGVTWARVYKTQLRSVTLGWVYLLYTSQGRDVVASVLVDLPVEYMGPWEFISAVW